MSNLLKDNDLQKISHLEKIVEEIRQEIPLSRVWISRYITDKKEVNMGRFVTSAQNQVQFKFASKGYFAEQEIPFTVTNVSAPITSSFPQSAGQMKTTTSVRLTIHPATEYLGTFKFGRLPVEVEETMLVSFDLGYEGRDGLIEDLRADIAEERKVENVVIRGSDKFYSLGVLVS